MHFALLVGGAVSCANLDLLGSFKFVSALRKEHPSLPVGNNLQTHQEPKICLSER